MLQVYLPIAEMSVNLLVMLGLGAAVGFLSGMFGVGGGFLLTPFLIFSGISAPIAVATGANQIVATSVSGALAQWRRNNIDFRMGSVLIAGGVVGAFIGVLLLKVLREAGQAGLIISLTYVALLSTIGTLMLAESIRAIRRTRAGRLSSGRRPGQHNWVHGLPLKMRFPRSRLYISAIPPLVIGWVVGLLTAFLGGGKISLRQVEYMGAGGFARTTDAQNLPNLLQRETEPLTLLDESELVDRRFRVAAIAGDAIHVAGGKWSG